MEACRAGTSLRAEGGNGSRDRKKSFSVKTWLAFGASLLVTKVLEAQQGSVGLWIIWDLVVGSSASPISSSSRRSSSSCPAEGNVGNSWVSCWADPWLLSLGLFADTEVLFVWGLLQLNQPRNWGFRALSWLMPCPAGAARIPAESQLIPCSEHFPWGASVRLGLSHKPGKSRLCSEKINKNPKTKGKQDLRVFVGCQTSDPLPGCVK